MTEKVEWQISWFQSEHTSRQPHLGKPCRAIKYNAWCRLKWQSVWGYCKENTSDHIQARGVSVDYLATDSLSQNEVLYKRLMYINEMTLWPWPWAIWPWWHWHWFRYQTCIPGQHDAMLQCSYDCTGLKIHHLKRLSCRLSLQASTTWGLTFTNPHKCQGEWYLQSSYSKQECIPVGCVPAARWLLSGGGVSAPRGCAPGGVSAPGRGWARGEGVSALGGRECLLPGGVSGLGVSASGGVCVSALGGGGLVQGWCLLLGGCLLRGGCLLQGVSAPGGGVYPSMHWGRHHPPPPVNRITDACKSITLAQLRCGR